MAEPGAVELTKDRATGIEYKRGGLLGEPGRIALVFAAEVTIGNETIPVVVKIPKEGAKVDALGGVADPAAQLVLERQALQQILQDKYGLDPADPQSAVALIKRPEIPFVIPFGPAKGGGELQEFVPLPEYRASPVTSLKELTTAVDLSRQLVRAMQTAHLAEITLKDFSPREKGDRIRADIDPGTGRVKKLKILDWNISGNAGISVEVAVDVYQMKGHIFRALTGYLPEISNLRPEQMVGRDVRWLTKSQIEQLGAAAEVRALEKIFPPAVDFIKMMYSRDLGTGLGLIGRNLRLLDELVAFSSSESYQISPNAFADADPDFADAALGHIQKIRPSFNVKLYDSAIERAKQGARILEENVIREIAYDIKDGVISDSRQKLPGLQSLQESPSPIIRFATRFLPDLVSALADLREVYPKTATESFTKALGLSLFPAKIDKDSGVAPELAVFLSEFIRIADGFDAFAAARETESYRRIRGLVGGLGQEAAAPPMEAQLPTDPGELRSQIDRLLESQAAMAYYELPSLATDRDLSKLKEIAVAERGRLTAGIQKIIESLQASSLSAAEAEAKIAAIKASAGQLDAKTIGIEADGKLESILTQATIEINERSALGRIAQALGIDNSSIEAILAEIRRLKLAETK